MERPENCGLKRLAAHKAQSFGCVGCVAYGAFLEATAPPNKELKLTKPGKLRSFAA